MSSYLSLTWYRVWSDGWIEQGGVALYPKLGANKTGTTAITLLKAYQFVNYTFLTNIITDGINTWSIKVFRIDKEQTICYVWWASTHTLAGMGEFCWYACGYQ